MKHVSTRRTAFLCVVACVTVAAIEVWPASRRVRATDQNGDGRPDLWQLYDDRGQLAEVQVDSNFDGRPDIEEYYERGVLIRRESDRNFNGQADLVEEFDAETSQQTRSLVDIDYDGSADLLVLFQDGRPVFSKRTVQEGRGIPTSSSPSVDKEGPGHLGRLMDPFESETAVRALHTPSSADGCIGLSSSGGLPRPCVSIVGVVPASAGLLARDVRVQTLTPLPRRSPRAPPLS